LRNWGVKKYNTNTAVTTPTGNHTLEPTDATSSGEVDNSHNLPSDRGAEDTSKRRRSAVSFQSMSSAGDNQTRPLAKRGKMDTSPDHIAMGLAPTAEGTEPPRPGTPSSTCRVRVRDEVFSDISDQLPASHQKTLASLSPLDSETALPLPGVELNPTPITALPSEIVFLKAESEKFQKFLESAEALNAPAIPVPRIQEEALFLEANLMSPYGLKFMQNLFTVGPVRELDFNLPVDTFSRKDLESIKRAADYLAVLGFGEEAFELYTLLLKRYLSDSTYRDTSYWYLVTQSVRVAKKPAHVEIIHTFLLSQLDGIRSSQPAKLADLYQFMIDMFLAVCNRTRSPSEMKDYLARATACLRENPSIGEQGLPKGDRSLDLPFFRQVLRIAISCDLKNVKKFSLPTFDASLYPANKPRGQVTLEEIFIRRCPGPFEVGPDDIMHNPCVRSCLSWCTTQLYELDSIPARWLKGVMGPRRKTLLGLGRRPTGSSPPSGITG